jgi:hypothetical protein
MEELSRILLTKSGRSDVATSINTTRTIPEFWQILDERAGDGKDPKRDRRALVVIDNIDTIARSLDSLLPPQPTRNRPFIIGQEAPETHISVLYIVRGGSFREEESYKLFENVLGDQFVQANKTYLNEIAQQFDLIPAYVYSVSALSYNVFSLRFCRHTLQLIHHKCNRALCRWPALFGTMPYLISIV